MGRRRRPAALTRRRVLRAGLGLAGGLALPAPLLVAARRAAARPPAADLEAEVCIIGSGPAGAVLGCALARRGIPVLLLESGPAYGAPRGAQLAALDAWQLAGTVPYPLATSRFRGAGGTSNLWSGTTPRLHPIDFEPNAYTPPGAAWPIRYDDLEPYYLPAERELRVRGVDHAAHQPPRSQPFPRTFGGSLPNLTQVLRRTGAGLALARLPYSDVDGMPLRVAAVQLPELAASRYATVVSDATVTGLQCAPDGTVEGVRLERFDGPPRTARARFYVVACGGLESARVLLLTRPASAPDGLGNRSGQLGGNFQEHPMAAIGSGWVEGDWARTPRAERVTSEEFLLDAKRQGLGGVRIRVTASTPPVGGGMLPPAFELRDAMRTWRRLELEVKGEIELEPSPHNRVTLTDDRRDPFGLPGARLTYAFTENDQRTIRHATALVRQVLEQLGAYDIHVATDALRWGHHHLGTCRMGDDPATSVLDRELRVHGSANLYVAGSACFVTSGVSNPTLTITALSLRLADHLAGRLRASA